ncbi:MarR family transcriptional regulator [Halobacillus sp. ACCC02827]|uniref:MarR family winged helix-turn-helix transcriptional regulator n=1 Tax=Bacillaceae TaxID=186817 RepID=UPI0002A4F9FF|nr:MULTISPECIES: MarR family transcriptional regulator [Bacillaceae]ELK48063.1 MarR family transcriptional regulator [Halobacillus sp. BAB-2008]QHT45632.1 MarR family transcriptional regulator [Bacillus sp. SB49]WJE16428.1 MarR family transcriptional regulator [Halobacillus sp. ACCC02827]
MKRSFQNHISIKLHQTDLKLTSFIKAKLAPYNLAPEQNLIMMLLWEEDGLTQNQIANYLGKDKANIARMASSLEKKGYIERCFRIDDMRSLELHLTESGRMLEAKVTAVTDEINEVVNQTMTEAEMNELDRLLLKMQQSIDE